MGIIDQTISSAKWYWRHGEKLAIPAVIAAICAIDLMADTSLNKDGSSMRRAICSTYSDKISEQDCWAVMATYAVIFFAFLPAVIISPTKIVYQYYKNRNQENSQVAISDNAVTVQVDEGVANMVEAIASSNRDR